MMGLLSQLSADDSKARNTALRDLSSHLTSMRGFLRRECPQVLDFFEHLHVDRRDPHLVYLSLGALSTFLADNKLTLRRNRWESYTVEFQKQVDIDVKPGKHGKHSGTRSAEKADPPPNPDSSPKSFLDAVNSTDKNKTTKTAEDHSEEKDNFTTIRPRRKTRTC